MTPKRLISVIIPVRNRHELFLRTLHSVASQSVPLNQIELIVVDEASHPRIDRQFVSQSGKIFPRVKIIRNPRPFGPSQARNIGLKKATGNLIYFLDSDDLWDKDFLNSTSPFLAGTESCLVTTLGCPIFVGSLNRITQFKYWLLTQIRNMTFLFFYIANHQQLPLSWLFLLRLSNTGFNRQALDNVYFSHSYKAAEDWKFFWDCFDRHHPRINLLPFSLAGFTYSPKSISLSRHGYFSFYFRFLDELPPAVTGSFGFRLFRFYAKISSA